MRGDMIGIKTQKNKTKKNSQSAFGKTFTEIRNLDIERREKIVQRQILAVEAFIKKSREKNPHFSWSHAPWLVQFLPVITKFFKEWGNLNAVNPGLSGVSGLMGVSKVEINKRLNDEFRPRNRFLKKLPKSREILEEEWRKKYHDKLRFPVIFKPSIGERCTGVNFVLEEKLDEFLAKNQNLKNIILEEFIQTEKEFGLSWVRDPKTKKIEIIALTERDATKVIGDGKSSLRNLITKKCHELSISPDRQKNIFAGFSVEKLNEKLIGSQTISRTASIAYGTVLHRIKFDEKQKEHLSQLVAQIINDFSGLYVGRFDIKANSVEELLAGKCKILEMNGVAGTPLDIYDDKISIQEKYEILFDYFSRILAIADQNIANDQGEAVSKIKGVKNVYKLLFGKEKTQELPENAWRKLREVFKISLKGRWQASDLGNIFEKFKIS